MNVSHGDESNNAHAQSSLPMLLVAIHVVVRYFIDRPATLATLLYAYGTYAGFLYSKKLYAEFGVDIFEYAQATDFIFAALKEPVMVDIFKLMLVLGIVLISGFLLIRAYIMKPQTANTNLVNTTTVSQAGSDDGSAGRVGCLYEFGIYSALFVFIAVLSYFNFLVYASFSWPERAAVERAHNLKEGEGQMVAHFMGGDVENGFVKKTLALIGTPGDVFIFYSIQERKTIVVPASNIGSLAVQVQFKGAVN
jgi:hypothetical protein